ncbi:MAG TPA: helix-turn-helix domain-containing protein [Sphingomicrobium sp.]
MTNVSERALKRRLRAEGTSFRMLTADSRRDSAEMLLTDERLSISDIAEPLGFSDLPSFSQAFKRWSGVVLSVYPRQAPTAVPSGD